jgi:hypothetical protein
VSKPGAGALPSASGEPAALPAALLPADGSADA